MRIFCFFGYIWFYLPNPDLNRYRYRFKVMMIWQSKRDTIKLHILICDWCATWKGWTSPRGESRSNGAVALSKIGERRPCGSRMLGSSTTIVPMELAAKRASVDSTRNVFCRRCGLDGFCKMASSNSALLNSAIKKNKFKQCNHPNRLIYVHSPLMLTQWASIVFLPSSMSCLIPFTSQRFGEIWVKVYIQSHWLGGSKLKTSWASFGLLWLSGSVRSIKHMCEFKFLKKVGKDKSGSCVVMRRDIWRLI